MTRFIGISLSLCFLSSVVALGNPIPSFNLYKGPDLKAGVIEQVPVSKNLSFEIHMPNDPKKVLVQISKQGQWVKVADMQTGIVGWYYGPNLNDILKAFHNQRMSIKKTASTPR